MPVEGNLNKYLYKAELWLIKAIPVITAGIALLNTVLSYFGIDLVVLSFLGSQSLLSVFFLYLSSAVFKFCVYHRLFIHYTTLNWVLNLIDYYIGIPLSDRGILILYLIITGIFIFLITYFRKRLK